MYNPQLDTFLRVADAGSFNKAAEESYITPTAVIKQINLLESSLDVKLFERTHRGLILTKAGKSLYQDTKYIIQYCKDSVTRAKNAMQEDTNIIRIGTSPLTPAQLLMQLWPRIQEQCPDMKFQIIPYENTPENAREIYQRLAIGPESLMAGARLDFCHGLDGGHFHSQLGGHFFKVFLGEASAAHRLRRRQEAHGKRVASHHHVVVAYGIGTEALRRCRTRRSAALHHQ